MDVGFCPSGPVTKDSTLRRPVQVGAIPQRDVACPHGSTHSPEGSFSWEPCAFEVELGVILLDVGHAEGRGRQTSLLSDCRLFARRHCTTPVDEP